MIVTKRLELRKYDPDKSGRLEQMALWLNDPEVVAYSEQRHRRHDWESQLQYITDVPDVFREIHLKNRFIGTITAAVDRPNAVADVGILIGEKSEWGKGYGSEAWIAFCNYLFQNGIRKIEAGAMNINTGMVKIFQKSGMHFEGYRDGHFLIGEDTAHMVLWGKFT